MADPTPYSVSYSFTGYQAVNPALPLPAAEVDVEFANIALSIGETVTALASIRRADGALQNGVVTWDGLDADVQEMIAGAGDRVAFGDISPTAFANQTEAEAGVTGDKLMTPLSTKYAIDAQRAIASQSAAEAGADNTTVLTPLRGKQQADAIRPFASQALAEAAVDNASVMTPLRTKQQRDATRPVYSANVVLTWGSIAAGASGEQSVTVSGAPAGVNARVIIGPPASGVNAGLVAQAWVSAANTVRIRLTNVTGSAITPHSGAATTYGFTVLGY